MPALSLDEQQLVYACGYNATGQLGCGDQQNRIVPWLVNARECRGRVEDVACGSSYSVVLVRGSVLTFGKAVRDLQILEPSYHL